MQVQQLGHAVLKVRDIEVAERFYNGVLGLPIAARLQQPFQMTFFTLGNHHDFAILAVGSDGPDAAENGPGLFHVAFKIGDSLDQLRVVKKELEAAGVPIDLVADHTVTQSIYVPRPGWQRRRALRRHLRHLEDRSPGRRRDRPARHLGHVS